MSDQEVSISVQNLLDGAHLAEAMQEEHAALSEWVADFDHRHWPRLIAAQAAVAKALEDAKKVTVT